MILNTWNKITLICGNHGDDCTHQMQIKQYENDKRDTVFYSCPEYKSIYGSNHDGRSCNNRLSIKDYERMMEKISDLADDGAEIIDIEGAKWTDRGIDYTVLKDDGKGYTVSVLNRKAMAK